MYLQYIFAEFRLYPPKLGDIIIFILLINETIVLTQFNHYPNRFELRVSNLWIFRDTFVVKRNPIALYIVLPLFIHPHVFRRVQRQLSILNERFAF